MIFHEVKDTEDNKYYKHFFVDASGMYSIGISGELYKRNKIQFMCRSAYERWSVIREWVTYDEKLMWEHVDRIKQKLILLQPDDPFLKADEKYGSVLWHMVIENALPANKYKYLEDEYVTTQSKVRGNGIS